MTKSVYLIARVTEAERARVAALAADLGSTVSEVVRALVLGAIPRPKDEAKGAKP